MPKDMGLSLRERPEYYDFGPRSSRPQEDILRDICAELHGGDWTKFESHLVRLSERPPGRGPMKTKHNTILADLQWIRCHRKADRLPVIRKP